MSQSITDGKLTFEPHAGFGTTDPEGNPWPFGYISTSPTPQPIFELNVLLVFNREETFALARRMAAVNLLFKACQEAKQFLLKDLEEPGRTVFWNLVAALQAAEGKPRV